MPVQGDVVCIFEGPGRDLKSTVASTFRATNNTATRTPDCEQKITMLIFNEESIRARKKRIRGGDAYSVRGCCYFQSVGALVRPVAVRLTAATRHCCCWFVFVQMLLSLSSYMLLLSSRCLSRLLSSLLPHLHPERHQSPGTFSAVANEEPGPISPEPYLQWQRRNRAPLARNLIRK